MTEPSHSLRDRLLVVRQLQPLQRLTVLVEAGRHAAAHEWKPIATELIDFALVRPVLGRPAKRDRVRGRVRGASAGSAPRRGESAADVLTEARLLLGRRLAELPVDLRYAAASAGADAWPGIFERLAAGPPADRAAAIAVAAASPRTAPSVLDLLHDSERTIARSAEANALGLTLAALGDEVDDALLGPKLAQARAAACGFAGMPERRTRLLRGVVDAAWSYADHEMRGVVLAAALLTLFPRLVDPGVLARASRLLEAERHPALAGLQGALRRSGEPIGRLLAWRLFAQPALSEACAERLSIAENSDEHRLVLSCGHLLLNPARAAAAERLMIKTRTIGDALVLDPRGVVPDQSALRDLRASERVGAVRVIGAVRAQAEVRQAAQAPMLADPAPEVRLTLCRAGTPADAVDLMFDADPAVAGHAAVRWGGSGGGLISPQRPAARERRRIARLLERSPHAMLRRVGREERARVDVLSNPSPMSRVVARRWHADDPRGLLVVLADALQGDNERERVAAASLAASLGIVDDLEQPLVVCATDDGYRRSAATAVHVFGAGRREATAEAARAAVRAADDRVRANAVEACVARGIAPPSVLVELKADPAHRVRANALRALSQTGTEAASEIESMLTDDRVMHRVAGLWLTERVLTGRARESAGGAWNRLAKRVAGSAAQDADAAVRGRAQRCAHRLLRQMDLIEAKPATAHERDGAGVCI